MRFLWLTLLLATAEANFDHYFFSGNATCPGMAFSCPAPVALCAHEVIVDKFYCCSGGEDGYPLCWDGSTPCSGPHGNASASQILCSEQSPWCCLEGTETCTQVTNQFNVCHSTSQNILLNISQAVLNRTYSSLSSKNPSATAYTFNAEALVASSTSSSSTAAASTSAPADSTAKAGSGAGPPETVSGGFIAGIVVAAVIALLLIVGAFVYCTRRRRRAIVPVAPAHEMATSARNGNGDRDTLISLYQDRDPHQWAAVPPSSGFQYPSREAHELGVDRETRELFTEPAEAASSDPPRRTARS